MSNTSRADVLGEIEAFMVARKLPSGGSDAESDVGLQKQQASSIGSAGVG